MTIEKDDNNNWKEQFYHLNNYQSEDDLLFLLTEDSPQFEIKRRPINCKFIESRKINFKQTVLLNKVVQAKYLIAISICSISTHKKVVISQRLIKECFASPKANCPSVIEFTTRDIFHGFSIDSQNSLLCIEIINPKGEFIINNLNEGDLYIPLRNEQVYMVFEGSISYKDINSAFHPIKLSKDLVLKGPLGNGKVFLTCMRGKLSILEAIFFDSERSKIAINVFGIEVDWRVLVKHIYLV